MAAEQDPAEDPSRRVILHIDMAISALLKPEELADLDASIKEWAARTFPSTILAMVEYSVPKIKVVEPLE